MILLEKIPDNEMPGDIERSLYIHCQGTTFFCKRLVEKKISEEDEEWVILANPGNAEGLEHFLQDTGDDDMDEMASLMG